MPNQKRTGAKAACSSLTPTSLPNLLAYHISSSRDSVTVLDLPIEGSALNGIYSQACIAGAAFLNAAVVPRRKKRDDGSVASHFLVVTLLDGIVTQADNVWVGASPDQECSVLESEGLVKSHRAADGKLVRSYYRAFHKDWRDVVTEYPPKATESTDAGHSDL